jgi:hypothetical protein
MRGTPLDGFTVGRLESSTMRKIALPDLAGEALWRSARIRAYDTAAHSPRQVGRRLMQIQADRGPRSATALAPMYARHARLRRRASADSTISSTGSVRTRPTLK